MEERVPGLAAMAVPEARVDDEEGAPVEAVADAAPQAWYRYAITTHRYRHRHRHRHRYR